MNEKTKQKQKKKSGKQNLPAGQIYVMVKAMKNKCLKKMFESLFHESYFMIESNVTVQNVIVYVVIVQNMIELIYMLR